MDLLSFLYKRQSKKEGKVQESVILAKFQPFFVGKDFFRNFLLWCLCMAITKQRRPKMNEIAEIEVEEDLDLGYEELPPIMVDKRFFVGESFDLLTQGNFILNNLSESSRKDAEGNAVVDLGYAHWVVALLCGSLSGLLERLHDQLDESEVSRLKLGDALAGLTAHISSMGKVEEKVDQVKEMIELDGRTLTLERAAKILGISKDALRVAIGRGEYNAYYSCGHQYLDRMDLENTVFQAGNRGVKRGELQTKCDVRAKASRIMGRMPK